MSDQKRASLTTIGSSKKDKKVKEPRRTVRLKVNLSESNEKTCPEYNYVDLLNSVEKRRKLKKLDGGHAHPAANGLGDLDPFAEDDEDKLKEIARSFEERYGPPLTKKKCKKREDYMDIGAGYDETDPFIDNTDAYDEIVPEEMTTAHGGFYINSGALEYKRVEHNSDVSDAEEIKSSAKKKYKKILVSDNENEEEEEEEGDDLKEKPEPDIKELKTKEIKEDNVASNKRKSISREPDLVIKKRKKSVDGVLKKKSMTVKDLLKEKREVEKPEVKPAPVSVTPSTLPAPTTSPSVATVGKASESETPSSSVTEPKKSPTTSITDVIESVISAARAQDDSSSNSSSSLSKSHTDSSESSDEEDSMADGEKDKEKQPQKEEIKLPDNLPEDLRGVVVLLKNAAKTSAEGKCKFFSAEVNRLLLKVEQSSKAIGVLNRNLVYGHLASYLPCTKDTLMKRAKKLVIENEEDKLKEPMKRLKAVIEKMMPAIIEKHTKDCQTVAEEKGLEETPAAANSTGDAKNTIDGKKTKSGIPLRIFPWNDEVRSLLCEVVKIKLQSFELSKPRKESAKEFLKLFLDSEVRVLWPPGWMKTIILYRESRSVHCNAMTKPGKQSVAARKTVNKQAGNLPISAPQKTNVPGTNSVSRSNANTADTLNKSGAAASGLTKTPTNAGPKMGVTASGGAPKANVPATNSAPKTNSPSNGPSMKSSNTNLGNPKSSSPLSSSTASTSTITPVSSVSSNSPSVANNLPPSVSIIKCSTSQTITNTPSQRASSPSSRAVITSVSGSPHVSSNLHVSIAGGGGKSKAVANSNNSGGDTETPKAPSRTKSPPERNRESVVTKNPVMLSQMNLPDCISVTPANAMQAPATKSPSTPMMSLKQRILQVAGASSGSKQSPDVLNVSSGKASSSDNCEVLLVGENKREGKLNLSGVRLSGPNHPKSHPISMGNKMDSRVENEKEIQSKDSRNYVPRSSPPKDEKASEGRVVDETVTATDVLSQIINSSLGGFPNSSTIGKSGVSVESLSQRRGDHHGDRHPGMLARNIPHMDLEGKDKMKDIVRASPTKCSQSSRVENSSATVTDAEESVQLEVDRVMKELLELREMTEDSMESESDKRVGHYRPTDKTPSSLSSHMLSSSVSVIAMNSASSKHHTANSQTKMSPSVSQISSNAMNSSLSPSANTQMKRSSSVPYGSSSNPMPSTKSYGFQDEFQRHMLQDCSKNSIDSDGAVYLGNKVPKDGERNRTANYNSVHRNAPHGSPASLERSQGLHNSADGTNDYDKVLMSLSHLKNMGVRHKQNNPPNAHQYTRHSQPTHNSSEMESCPNINFSGNCVKPRISSQQFSRPELLTQAQPHIPQNIK